MKKKIEVQTSVNRIKCTMLPLIFMRLSDVTSAKCTMLPLIFMRLSDVKENKKI